MRNRTVSAGVAIALVTALGVARHPAALQGQGQDPAFATRLESRAPGAFEPTSRAPLGGLNVTYRLDAQVLLPLLVTSLTIYSRENVGSATASYRDAMSDSGDLIRAFEFFTTSVPERARGMKRMGFFREAVDLGPVSEHWTAYFGVMSASPEQTLAQARAATENATMTYQITDGFSSSTESAATRYDVTVDRPGTSAADLYATVRPLLRSRPPRFARSLQGTPRQPLPSLAFLGALQVSLRELALSRAHSGTGRAPDVAFVHDGSVRHLKVDGLKADPASGRPFVAGGFVKDVARVYRIDFRIVNPGSEDGPFRLWAELPSNVNDRADALPIAPIMFELLPRSFLRLHYERTR
jgi:hypothetical protein